MDVDKEETKQETPQDLHTEKPKSSRTLKKNKSDKKKHSSHHKSPRKSPRSGNTTPRGKAEDEHKEQPTETKETTETKDTKGEGVQHNATEEKKKKPALVRTPSQQNMERMSAYERAQLKVAQDNEKLQKFYNPCVGLHDELLDKSTGFECSQDVHANPAGAEFDLGRDGAYSAYTILIGNFVGYSVFCDFSRPKEALEKKGFKVLEVTSELLFTKLLPVVDVAWVVSAAGENATSERYPSWITLSREEFVEACLEFHLTGGGLYIWGDNEPLFEHANAILPVLFKNPEMVLIGNTPGGKVLGIGDFHAVGQFGPHMITSGIVNMYEGITICYPRVTGTTKVLATSTDGHPAILYADHETLDSNCGCVIVDCGYTKNYTSWDEAGAARLVVNANVWLLSLEHNLQETGGQVVSRRVRRGVDNHDYKSLIVETMAKSTPSPSHVTPKYQSLSLNTASVSAAPPSAPSPHKKKHGLRGLLF